ncbi:MAG: folate-binding protein YgfZ [Candidatus Accumulibacter sp.]|nr:folate-binding protein YgfZ [Accumulibacter sp.]
MNLIWQESLGAAGARFDQQRLVDFGDAAAERLAGRDATIVAPLTHLGLIEVAGDEATTFLHNQLTSDVKHLSTDSAQHSAWCSAKGRMIASFLLFRDANRLQLQLAAGLVPAIVRRLRMYVLRSRVTVTDRSTERCLLGVAGTQAETVLADAGLPCPPSPLTTASFADGVVIRLDDRRFEIAVADQAAVGLWKQFSQLARPVGSPVWEWLEIRAGVPLINERTQELFVPQMAHFERIGGVSFHKGCYPGQEVVARTQYLGKVKRHLYALHLPAPAAAGDALFSPANPEHACGTIANAAPAPQGGYDALAVLQESHATGDLRLGGLDGPQVSHLLPLGD